MVTHAGSGVVVQAKRALLAAAAKVVEDQLALLDPHAAEIFH